MKRFAHLLALVLLAAAAVFSTSPVAAQPSRSGFAPVLPAKANAIHDQYIVVLKDGADPRAVAG